MGAFIDMIIFEYILCTLILQISMWIWIFAFSISLFMTLNELSAGTFLSLLPIFIVCLFGIMEFGFAVYKYLDKSKSHIHITDVIEMTYVVGISLTIAILLYLEMEQQIDFNLFYILVFSLLGGYSIIYAVVGGYYNMFMNMSLSLRVLNVLTFLTTIATYLSFYAVENDWIEAWAPLVPFFTSVLIEIYTVYLLRKGSSDLTTAFSKRAARNRMVFSVCIGILCVVLIVHYTIDGMDLLFSLSASIVYLFGIVYLLLDQKNRTYLRFQCFKKPKWHELKSEEL